jgi:hypothetical protein
MDKLDEDDLEYLNRLLDESETGINRYGLLLFFPYKFVEIFPILRRNEREMIKNLYLSSCKVRVINVRF